MRRGLCKTGVTTEVMMAVSGGGGIVTLIRAALSLEDGDVLRY